MKRLVAENFVMRLFLRWKSHKDTKMSRIHFRFFTTEINVIQLQQLNSQKISLISCSVVAATKHQLTYNQLRSKISGIWNVVTCKINAGYSDLRDFCNL